MIELVPLLPIAFGALGLWAAVLQRRKRLRGWQEAAVACGLENPQLSQWTSQLTAQAGPLEVKIGTCGTKGRYTRIVLSIPGSPDFHGVSIRREPLVRWGREIETGDSPFDGTFFLEGPARQVLGLLDAETRHLLAEVNTVSRLELSHGTLRAEDMSDDLVPYALRLLLEIGRRLSPADVPRRLAANAHADPEPEVRLRNLLALAREYPGSREALGTLRTACSDPSPAIRLRAAQELGAEGRNVLRNLAESLEDDAVSAAAVSALAPELPFDRVKALLDRALDRRSLQTARVCLELLAQSGDAAADGVLAEVLVSEESDLAGVAAQALGATGSPAAEPPLIEALQREPASLRMAAAAALGRIGSAAAVLPLKETAERSWLDLEVRRAARQAIAEIQSRLQGASPGQLSLASSEAGQLSIAPFETGQLSLTQDEPPPREREAPAGRRA